MLVLAPVLAVLAGAADARENGRNGRSNEIEQRMRDIQAEIERQRRDMQRQQQEAMKAAEEARRQAEREMQRQREAMEREMRREQERLMREAERERERAMREAQQEQDRARREQERAAQAAEDAARKAAEQAQKAAEAQQRRLTEEQARRDGQAATNPAGVWRDALQDGTTDAATAGLKQFEGEQRRLDEEARKADERQRQRAVRAKDDGPAGDDARAAAGPRGARRLPAWLPSAAATTNARVPHRWDKKGASLAPMPRGRTMGNAKGRALGRAVAPALPRAVSYPGKEKGAEMPPDLFAKAREQEFVVPALTPDDLARAKQHGFELSTPVEIGERGTRMQRLKAPGFVGNEAERELHRALPFVSVTPNYAYSIFIGALGEAEPGKPATGKPTAASQDPCPQAVCFGERFIGWTGEARACAGAAKIGIIDTSFDTKHPAFANLRFESREFLDGARPSPYDWHGTAILSVLAGNPAAGTPGLAPGATYYLATAFRSDAAGNASTDTMRLLAALAWLEEQDVDVVNMSFAGPRDPAVAAAIRRLSKKGVVSVAAVGNMGPNAPPSYPAAYPQVIAVTAVNRQGNSYRNANRGPHVDVAAPGVDILTALPRERQGLKSGTSFAAPFVTAIVATHGDMAFTGAKSKVLAHVKTRDLGPPGRDPIYGTGLALAPRACGGGQIADSAKSRPSPAAASAPSWTTSNTLMRAGAGP